MREGDPEFRLINDVWTAVIDEMIAVGSANYIYNIKLMGIPMLADSGGDQIKTYYVTRFDDDDKEVWSASWSYGRYNGYQHAPCCNVRGDQETFTKDLSILKLLLH